MNKTSRTQRMDGEVTYNRILEAAGEFFASTGFAETTSKMVAARAAVDLASINYHFGSRNGLYQAVLVEAHRRLISVDSLQNIVEVDLPATEKLRMLIEELVESAIADKGWHATVLSREFLSPTSHLKMLMDTIIPAKMPPVLGILSEITGIMPRDPALLRCLASVLAPCAMLLVVGPNTFSFANEIHRMGRGVLVEHLYGFAIAGLEAIGRSEAQRSAKHTSASPDGSKPGETA